VATPVRPQRGTADPRSRYRAVMFVSEDLVRTRRSLHRVAEHVLAAARHAAEGRIGLRVVPGGFGTPPFPSEHGPRTLTVVGIDLVAVDDRGERRRALTTVAAAAEQAGIEPGLAPDVYPLATGPDPEAPLELDRAAAAELAIWFMRVDEALRSFLADRSPQPAVTLWPEHFDVAATVDEVNYGGSPGDDDHDVPYAYVGPWSPREGVFWNEPFGASRAATELPTAGAVLEFFREGEACAAT
jgi:hypothetical protein